MLRHAWLAAMDDNLLMSRMIMDETIRLIAREEGM